jgi:hypothetical protein
MSPYVHLSSKWSPSRLNPISAGRVLSRLERPEEYTKRHLGACAVVKDSRSAEKGGYLE